MSDNCKIPNPTMTPRIPLIDGTTFFCDNTTLEYITTCSRSAEYYILHRRIGAGSTAALVFGAAIHAALEWRYKHVGAIADESTQAGMNVVLTDYFVKNPIKENDYRNLSLATQVVKGYLDKYNPDWTPAMVNGEPFVEKPFAFELCRLRVFGKEVIVMWTGKIDLCVTEGRDLWVPDHKTTKFAGENEIEDKRMTPQWRGYCLALYKLTGIFPTGAIVNQIRVRPPTKAALEAQAGVATPTQGESLSDMLAASKKKRPRQPVEPDDFERHRFLLEHWMLDEWIENTTQHMKDFFRRCEEGFFPMAQAVHCRRTYGLCQYIDICKQPPASRIASLHGPLCQDATFSPLNAIKQQQNEQTITK